MDGQETYDESLPLHTRVQALTNLGNSYDSEGRDIDAIAAYDEVLTLDPRFGMALGNKGTALLYVAPFARNHQPTVIAEAAHALDAALADEDRIVEFGGESALEHFRERRATIKTSSSFVPRGHDRREWVDPSLRWCAEHGLFLHVSLACLSEDDEELDPLFFRGVTVRALGDTHWPSYSHVRRGIEHARHGGQRRPPLLQHFP